MAIAFSLILLVIPVAKSNTQTLIERFPAVQKGVFYFYEVKTINTKVTTRTWSWNYTIIGVDNDWVHILVEHWEHGNYSTGDYGNYTTRCAWRNLTHFEVFFDVSVLNEALEQVLKMWEGSYSIEKITYNFNGTLLNALKGIYNKTVYKENSTEILEKFYGYFIVSTDYGVILEKAQYVEFYHAVKTIPNNCVIKLEKTNFKDLAYNFNGENVENEEEEQKQCPWLYVGVAMLTIAIIVPIVWLRFKKPLEKYGKNGN